MVDSARAGRVYVTLSAYRSGSDRPYVLGSLDGGRHFVDVSGTLPRAPVNDLVIGRGLTLYVATDQGVFVSPTGGAIWLRQGRGLPMVPVDDIEYDATHQRLVAGTFGRGIYQVRVG
ncbi:hypothetical protein [Micromonospora cremea]|uniref:hypothetical protein n=1 Tax=Micromonospora cremea TaxID=709881 RepID=UPI00118145E4|nr:hypothetical protein [Micromonospora cremea]